MTRRRSFGLIALLFLLGALLALWAVREARAQRRQTEEELRAGASLLARTLVPALSAASAAARELDEIVAWKLLDNARLLSRLDAAGALGDVELAGLLVANGLDAVVFVDPEGRIERRAGNPIPAETVEEQLAPLVHGEADELILGWSPGVEHAHVAAAAARPGDGAVLVRTDASTAYAFARRLGVRRLLEDTVGTGGVLYLVYHEGPGGEPVQAAWDGSEIPLPPEGEHALRTVRGRSTFELVFRVPSPAGRSVSLRVGLDATPLSRAASAAMRRTVLVGAVLAAFAVAVAAYALVSRTRDLERAEGARRLAALEEARQRSERLAAAGSLAAGLAHEVRNPLNAISLAAQRIERTHPDDEQCLRFVERIRGEVGRLEEILKGFLDLARPAAGPRHRASLDELAQEVVELLGPEAASRAVRLEAHPGGKEASAVIDREAVRRAIVNLVRNAIEASRESGRVAGERSRRGHRRIGGRARPRPRAR
jgi:signal transduction histidine kinase